MMSKVIVHIDMDAFFAAVEQRDNPWLRGRPVIIGADPKKGKGRGVVATCSYEARRYGVHSAMPISVAYHKCPSGVFLQGDSQKYKRVSDQVFKILYSFTPDMEPVSIDEAFLDITGSYHFYQTPYQTCLVIKGRIKKDLGLTASVGIAPNKMAAKIASDISKPDGLLEIRPEQLFDFLWPLPVEKLWGVGKRTQEILNAMGVRTVGELARYSPESLRECLGAYGEHLTDLANGIDERAVFEDDAIKSVSHEHTFESDTKDREEIYRTLCHLSEKVSRRMRRYELKGKTVTLKVRLSPFKTITRAKTIGRPVNFFDEIYQASKDLFDAFYQSSMKIRLLGVRVSNFEGMDSQGFLFPDPVLDKREKVHRAVDCIKNKFGENAIRRARNV